jgi:hypothetical protein
LKSGAGGVLHIDRVLDYDEDPAYVAEVLTHRLTVETLQRLETSGMSRRALAARLHTSTPQLYRPLDPTNAKKSLAQLTSLLHLLDCEVAAVALTNGLSIVTANPKDFRTFRSLAVVNWAAT